MPSIWLPEIPVWEKVLRSLVVYLFLLLAFRVLGKRQVGQLTPFDLVVLLIISNVVQNAIIGPDNSLGGGLIGAAVIFLANYIVVEITFRFKGARRVIETQPTLLIHNGRILPTRIWPASASRSMTCTPRCAAAAWRRSRRCASPCSRRAAGSA
jgi:uncharacterized membrane protein YcaP (DUF421 family)